MSVLVVSGTNITMYASVTLLVLLAITNVELIPINQTQHENIYDTGLTIKGPIGTLLNDILLRVQQHDQEQRLDAIQQVQQRQLVQQQLQRQADGQRDNAEQLKQLQMNFTREIENLTGKLHEFHHNLTLELQRQQPSRPIDIPENSNNCNILMQQHFGGTTFFGKTWAEFKSEFGHVDGNYWIGNDRLHQLTKDGQYKLRVDLQARSNSQWYWAEYSTFIVGDEASGYILNIGGYTGNAGDSLAIVNNMKFSTKDRDNDVWSRSCAVDSDEGGGGGFWYRDCFHASINAPHSGVPGFAWHHLSIGLGWPDRKLIISRMSLIRK